ncbi:MAG: DUF3604 domain-containing protein [Armatimonadetes bacterium]|nr:DUF3604 domain-containing protein [Armatimonadota bacterium]
MAHRVRLLLALSVVLALPAPAQTGQRRQILDNGGFEQGLVNWEPHPEHVLIEDVEQAHSGERCLFGEVTKPSEARVLKRQVEMSPDRLYEFSIWARATNQTKLVLWRTTAGKRIMVDAWQRVPGKWTQYTVPVSVEEPGLTTLEIVAPSSYGEPVGKMWIDDVRLFEYDTPPAVEISGGTGFNDAPVLAVTSDGRVWMAWISFRDGRDTLQAAVGDLVAGTLTVARRWPVEGAQGYLLGPTLATDGLRVWLAYAQEIDGNWDVFAAPLNESGPGKPVRVTADPAVDVKPACGVTADGVWVAWESNRDQSRRQVYLARVRGDSVTEPVRLSTPGTNNYSPTLALQADGNPYVVWHGFRDGNADLFAWDGSNPRAGEQRLTTCSLVDREPRLVSGPQGLWLTWDVAGSAQYHVGSANLKRSQIGLITPDGLRCPIGLRETPLWARAEFVTPCIDPSGRLWVTCREPRGRAGWDVTVLCYSGQTWTQRLRVSAQKGLCRRAELAVVEDRAVVLFQADDIPSAWDSPEESASATSRILAAALDTSSAPQPAQLALEPYSPPQEPYQAAEIRRERGEDRSGWSIDYNGQRLNLYFGDLHEHSDTSVCNRTGDQTQDQSYQSMRDVACYDFAAITDHGYNLNAYLWSHAGKMARSNTDVGRFLGFLAEEWTSSFEEYDEKYPYGFYGHRNLILEDPYFPLWFNARDRKKPIEVWDALARENASYVHIPHQLADTGNVPTDWEFIDERNQPVAEIFQTRGSYEYKGAPRMAGSTTPEGWFLQDAWARGIVIGVIAAPDHGGGYGKAAVYAPELTRGAILDAMRARHTYGTTAAKILLDVRVNGHLMGEKAPAHEGRPVTVDVRVDCPAEIDKVEICRNNVFIHSRDVDGRATEMRFVDNTPPAGPCYYYVRVMQEDGEIAWSSPVWLGEPGPIN